MKDLEDHGPLLGTDQTLSRNGQTHVRHALHRLYHGMLTTTPMTDLLISDPFEQTFEHKNISNFAEVNPTNDTDSGKAIEMTQRLYFYGTPPLILFCIISVAINIKVLISVYWIRRPLSPTLHISLSLAGADAFSSTALGVGLVMNSFIPIGLGYQLSGVNCFLLGLEAIRLGSVIVTVAHLMALAANHYLGILRPLHYLSIMTHRNTTLLIVLLWVIPLSFFFSYFGLVENEGFQSEMCETHKFLLYRKFRLMFSSLFFGPFVVMVCIYTHIFCIVRRHQASRLRFSRAGSLHRGSNSVQQNSSQQMARNVKAIHTTLYILGSYVVGWMPGCIVYMLVCSDCILKFDWVDATGRFLVFNVLNCLIILKTLVNPIIYAARMHEIKVATRRMHASLCGGFVSGNSGSDGVGMGHSSEGNQSNRASISRTAVCRLTSNVSIWHPRNGSYTYTYTGNGANTQSNTVL